MLNLKISNSSCQSQCGDNWLAIEIDDLAASTIGGGASIGVAATAEGFGDATVWTIASSKSTPEGAEGMGLIAIGTPSVAGTSYRFEIGGKSIEFSPSNFFNQKFDGLQSVDDGDRSLLSYLFAR